MQTDTNDSEIPKAIIHVIDPERENTFRALAATSGYLKEQSRNKIRLKCTQCETEMEKPRKCSKCRSVLYCSQECQRKNWPTHKRICNEIEHSSGVLKLVRMFSVNPLLMMYLKAAIVLDCNLLNNPRVGFELPFLARVDIAFEPSDIFDFVGLYFDDKIVREKLQGMLQVNAMTPWYTGMHGERPLTPQRMNQWREIREKHNREGYDKDPVGLLDFSYSGLSKNNKSITYAVSVGCHINPVILEMAIEREPFVRVCPLAGTRFKQPMTAMTCLEYINIHIRADTQNQLRLRSEMTEQDIEVIHAAGRDEDEVPAQVLKEKMEREIMYNNIVRRAKGAHNPETHRARQRMR
ncbi:uncharacterized protein EDB93DRAFT_635445 [Suillus bovinus]|uniref:uncharacterized protein n=1 Tax=Suillus bovinus TaxID=48563 RepID=UPI001B86ACEB|nr:uncharacterized protein EDB93DRAFT_635445 [Suillus bovinus]KAG2141434.1 hypothetical protein EDB93DRAFT_635445 [Suillus bovinus]